MRRIDRLLAPAISDGGPHRRRALVRLVPGVILTVALLGAGGSGVASAAAATVQVATVASFGPILTNGSGFALYSLNTDHNGQSTCHGSCATVWPALDVPAGTAPSAGPGVTGTVGTAVQANGTVQVTYNGAPLYTFLSDTAPGQVTGDGVAGFSVVRVSAPTTTTTTTTPAGVAPTATTPPPTASGTPPSATSSSGATASGPPAPGASPATPGTLAFTGAGPGLAALAVVGIMFGLFGLLLTFRPRRRAGRTAG